MIFSNPVPRLRLGFDNRSTIRYVSIAIETPSVRVRVW